MKKLLETIEPFKIYIILAGIVLSVFLAVYFQDNISDWWHDRKAQEFNEKMAEADAKVKEIQSDNDQLRGQIQSSMEKGQSLELERDALKQELERFGAQGKAAVQAQEEARVKYEADKQNITADSTLYDRCVSLCESRAEVGHPCKPSLHVYCQQYTGR